MLSRKRTGDHVIRTLVAMLGLSLAGVCSAQTVYVQNFESGNLPSEWSGAGSVQSSQGLFAFGAFGQWQLRNSTPASSVLSLADLPAHTSVSLTFSLAAWDGLNAATDRFTVRVDGTQALSSALGGGVGPGASVLMPVINFGYGSGVDYAFVVSLTVPHSSSTLTLEFANASAGTNNGSIGLDNVSISVSSVPEPSALVLGGLGLFSVLRHRKRSSVR